jgi:hypothetical protein
METLNEEQIGTAGESIYKLFYEAVSFKAPSSKKYMLRARI